MAIVNEVAKPSWWASGQGTLPIINPVRHTGDVWMCILIHFRETKDTFDTFHWACKLKQTNKNIYKTDIMLFGANEMDLVFMKLDITLTSCSPFLPPSPRHFGPSWASLQSTLALGASNWKWYWGWESSVSTLIPPLGEAHMVSITPQPRTLGPLSMLFLSISPACSSANAPGRTLFFRSLCY